MTCIEGHSKIDQLVWWDVSGVIPGIRELTCDSIEDHFEEQMWADWIERFGFSKNYVGDTLQQQLQDPD